MTESDKIEVWHPSCIWEWYRDGKRHHDNGKGFVSFPDYQKELAAAKMQISELENSEESAQQFAVKTKQENATLRERIEELVSKESQYVANEIRQCADWTSEIQERDLKIKELVECLKVTMGCGYTWDDLMTEEEHDEKCDVCKCLKKVGEL